METKHTTNVSEQKLSQTTKNSTTNHKEFKFDNYKTPQ